ncbi:hypothetical protein Salat_1197500 [Sesamum alatum]|uniref:Uncharacterized protein n=1 Tax=Sesamum alatum TaxID=300844 RepID=A0AAE2CNR9_9LAMI|nr:hypothetical protein Salat_1197500 [Sesamum alatum]
MTRGFAPLPPSRGRGRGRGHVQVVRPPTPDASDALEASSQALPTPLAASASDEPPQSPLVDPTPLGPSTMTPMTSQGGGIPCAFPQPIIHITFTYNTLRCVQVHHPCRGQGRSVLPQLHRLIDFGPLHGIVARLQKDP